MTKPLMSLLVLLYLSPAQAQNITASESCAALAQAEAQARTVYSTSTTSWWVHYRECFINWYRYAHFNWRKGPSMDQEWYDHCEAVPKMAATSKMSQTKYLDHVDQQNEQKCLPSPPTKKKDCTATQTRHKQELEQLARALNSTVICGNELRAEAQRLAAAAGPSREVIESCDCEVKTPDVSDQPPTTPANMTPEQQTVKTKLDQIYNKYKEGNDTYQEDLGALKNDFGVFSGTSTGMATGQGLPPGETTSAVENLENLMAEIVTEKKGRKPEEEKLEGRSPLEPSSPTAGTEQKPPLKSVWDTQQKTEPREYWKKKADDKKNGISDNPLRNIFAQVSSRYTVESQDLNQFLNIQKGKYHTQK